MRIRPIRLVSILTAIASIVVISGCGTGLPGDNTTDQITPTPVPGEPTPTPIPSASSLTIVKTAIPVHVQAHVFDITAPTADPVVVDNPDGINSKVQMVFRNGKFLYADYSNEYLQLADVASGSITLMTVDSDQYDMPTLIDIDMNGDKLGYFCRYWSHGINYRSAVGAVASAPGVTLAPDKDSATQIDGSTDNNGFVGWASTMAITPDGSKIFIAGHESIGQGEYLQYGTGGAFTVLQSADSPSDWGFSASDVSASNNTVAFKGGTNEDTYVCYIKLQ